MNWSDLGETVADAAPLLGSALGPIGAGVGSVIAAVFGSKNEPDALAQAIKADPQAAAKLREIELNNQAKLQGLVIEANTKRLAEVNKTIRTETQADDKFVRRWRPTFGYCMAFTWVMQILGMVGAIAYAIIAEPGEAAVILNALAEVNAAMVTMWAVALSVIGVSVYQRSQDKKNKLGLGSTQGLLGSLVNRMSGSNGG